MTAATVLHLDKVTSGYPGHRVLQPVNLTAAPGQIVVVNGSNAAGKSTLIHTVAGHLPAASGRILLDGRDITNWPAHRRARAGIGLVPQERQLFASLTVAEHLHLAAATQAAVDHVLGLLPHLRTRLRHRPAQMSGGEQQMLALARALVRQPRLLLLDEPAEGLATAVADNLARIITGLATAGTTVLITEHHAALATLQHAHHYQLSRGVLTRSATTAHTHGAKA